MSLNSVVNNLVRAAAGISTSISDTDLDAHVAKLLADEAKARELKWSELGLTGLLGTSLNRNESSDSNLPKTNKRFLASVIRNVDGHNSALLKAQAQAAYESRRREERGESSRSSHRKQVGNRLFGGALRDVGRNSGGRHSSKGKERARESDRDRDHERDRNNLSMRTDVTHRDRSDRRRREHEDEEDQQYTRESSRRDHEREYRKSRDIIRDRSRDRDRDRDRHKGRPRERRDRGSQERDEQNREDQARHGVRTRNGDHTKEERDHARPAKNDENNTKPSRSRRRSESSESRTQLPSPSPLPSPVCSRSPSPPPAPLSKMDKYFSTTYDPRLDFASIPKEGLIQDVGWDNMLAVLKEKGKKRRHQSPSLSDDIPAPPQGVLPSKRHLDENEYDLESKAKKKERKERKSRQGWDSDDEEREREKRKAKKKKEKERAKEKEDEEKYSNLKKEGGATQATSGLLDGYRYVKKGGTREWDAGK
ncbi:uncharacterized protein I303_107152 [Kwoniella dejecticola CBS 10117]|uniref:Pre-mRNA-splicing factor 38B n=1 Tax=Kwoniella dejecticola CBS 10117 TaxID=1296121 RepID=A0A1A5ZYW7_9TREE|nr:uncharacterized protein I303_06553 [Kwoniella dejecticola CBS 10117]OBR82995.1 hypothetical protein I303_06553 [Kwoniella dejecticola CBS 10117]